MVENTERRKTNLYVGIEFECPKTATRSSKPTWERTPTRQGRVGVKFFGIRRLLSERRRSEP